MNSRIWNDKKVRRFKSPCTRELFAYLITVEAPLPGLVPTTPDHIALDLRFYSADEIRASLAELEALEMVEYDPDARLVRVPEAVKHNPPSNANTIKGWWRRYHRLEDSPLKLRQVERIRARASRYKWFAAIWAETFGTLEPHLVPAPAEQPRQIEIPFERPAVPAAERGPRLVSSPAEPALPPQSSPNPSISKSESAEVEPVSEPVSIPVGSSPGSETGSGPETETGSGPEPSPAAAPATDAEVERLWSVQERLRRRDGGHALRMTSAQRERARTALSHWGAGELELAFEVLAGDEHQRQFLDGWRNWGDPVITIALGQGRREQAAAPMPPPARPPDDQVAPHVLAFRRQLASLAAGGRA